MKNNQTASLVVALRRLAIEQERPLWKRIAADLEAPARNRRVVNLWRIDEQAKEGETVLVPGKVLGDGLLTKKITIAAASCSSEAKRKLAASGSKLLTIEELAKKRPDGKDIRILG